jgi:glucose/arabinose dehydrogenase
MRPPEPTEPIVSRRLVPLLLILTSIVAPLSHARAATITATPVKTGLRDPTAFTFAPDGRIYYVERTKGQIRILDPATGTSTLFFAVTGPLSMMGIALHPDFPTKPWVYVYGTRNAGGQRVDQLLRLSAKNGKGTNLTVLVSRHAAPPRPAHHGGRLLFGPDGDLYLVIGDQNDPATSQKANDIAGKLLRMTPTGARAPGNPSGTRIYASGVRNSIGFDFDPIGGRLWMDDNGPECNDELDLIVAGGNYGWGPHETCQTPPAAPANTNQDGANPILPESYLATTVGPTGLAFCDACGLDDGSIYYGDVNQTALHEVVLDAQRDDVVSDTVVYTHGTTILSIEEGPGGVLYLSDPTGIYRLSVG